MSLPVACLCGHEWPDLRGFEGQIVNCPVCGNTVRVPGKSRAGDSERLGSGLTRPGLPQTSVTALTRQKPAVPATAPASPEKAPTAAMPARPSTRAVPAPKPAWQSPAQPEAQAGADAGLDEARMVLGQAELVARFTGDFQERAAELLRAVARMAYEGQELEAGARVPCGWATLALRAERDLRILCAPDFERNPCNDFQDDLTLAFTVAAAQEDVVRRAGVKRPMPCHYTDAVTVASNALTQRLITAERRDFPTRERSGWVFLPGDPADRRRAEEKKKFEATQCHRLLGRRDVLLHLLPLPVGYTVTVENDRIVSVLNASAEQVWRE